MSDLMSQGNTDCSSEIGAKMVAVCVDT